MKLMKKIGKVILWFFLIIIILYNLYTFLSFQVFKKNLVGIGGYATLEVVSGSMEPTIQTGDLIIIHQGKKDYQENDIITFMDVNGSFVTHRIVGRTSQGYLTKGDANKSVDPGYVRKEKIVGTYVFKIHKFGYIVKSIQNPITLVFVFIIGVMACVVISIDKDFSHQEMSEEEKAFLKRCEEEKEKEGEQNERITTK